MCCPDFFFLAHKIPWLFFLKKQFHELINLGDSHHLVQASVSCLFRKFSNEAHKNTLELSFIIFNHHSINHIYIYIFNIFLIIFFPFTCHLTKGTFKKSSSVIYVHGLSLVVPHACHQVFWHCWQFCRQSAGCVASKRLRKTRYPNVTQLCSPARYDKGKVQKTCASAKWMKVI